MPVSFIIKSYSSHKKLYVTIFKCFHLHREASSNYNLIIQVDLFQCMVLTSINFCDSELVMYEFCTIPMSVIFNNVKC